MKIHLLLFAFLIASAAGLAVLEVLDKERLIDNAAAIGEHWMNKLQGIPALTGLRGRGLMIGLDLPEDFKHVRTNLLMKHHIFTGEAKPNTIRLLPSLAMTIEEADMFLKALNEELA